MKRSLLILLAILLARPLWADEPEYVYTVRQGDNLWEVAAEHYGTRKKWRDIAEWNHLDENAKLHAGQKLILKGITPDRVMPYGWSKADPLQACVVDEGGKPAPECVKKQNLRRTATESPVPESAPSPPPQASPAEESRHEPAWSWTGFYAGLNAGGQWGNSSDKTGAFGYNADNQVWSYGESGFVVAGEFGYNFQWDWLVVGPEVEVGYVGMNGSGVQPGSPGGDTLGKSSSNVFTTLRGRAGVGLDHWLIYATGGAIGANYTASVVDGCNIAPCGGSTVNATSKSFDFGYTVGGGIEHLFSKDWSIKAEYLYFALGSQPLSGTTNLGVSYNWSGQTSGNIIRAGLNFHF